MATVAARGVTVRFQGLTALDNVDIACEPGRIVGLIGPNGAGKTTLLNVLSGFQRPAEGKVLLGETDITRKSPHAIARLGLARTFQAVHLFGSLSVLENLQIGAAGVGLGLAAAERRSRDIAGRLSLDSRLHTAAEALPYGEERRVGIARALAMKPSYLMLDEPAAGLNEAEVNDLLSLLKALPGEFDCGLLVIEHNMNLIMALCDHIYVLDQGRVLAHGAPEVIRQNADVRRAYLGPVSDKAQPPVSPC